MKKNILLIVFLVLGLFTAKSQEYTNQSDSLIVEEKLSIFDELKLHDTQGRVELVQDIRVNKLVNKRIKISEHKNNLMGWRINIFGSNSQDAREVAETVITQFNEYFPDIAAYKIPLMPTWKVYVGDYRTKDDALKDLQKIKIYYKDAFVKDTKINYPKL